MNDVVDSISDRMHVYELLLRASRGFFDSSEFVSGVEWKTFVDALQLSQNYPGIRGLGFSLKIQPQDLPAIILQQRKAGMTHFKVWPVY